MKLPLTAELVSDWSCLICADLKLVRAGSLGSLEGLIATFFSPNFNSYCIDLVLLDYVRPALYKPPKFLTFW